MSDTPPTLLERLEAAEAVGASRDGDLLLETFVDWAADQGLDLYPAQEEAILEVLTGNHVILKTPTGSGKSLVATAMHFRSIALGRRSVYTSPIKALVTEKFFQLCTDFGAQNVGMMTGDATVNRDAPILTCTAEILANMTIHQGETCGVNDVIMDEFHYYADRDRGMAWQVPLLTLPRASFLLMSATLGDTTLVEAGLEELTGQPVQVVSSDDRPVPLTFEYSDTPVHETIATLVSSGRAPVYVVNFTQRSTAEMAQALMSSNYTSKEQKKEILRGLHGVRFDTPYGKDVQRYLKHGIGLHHGGLMPKYRLLAERLARQGLLQVISGTDTLGVGVNVPIRTVLFTRLCKYDGEKTRLLTVRDFKQIAGRAGRKGFDDQGFVVCQAPEHVIENRRLAAKAEMQGRKKFSKKQPPDKGFLMWSNATFEGLIHNAPEPLQSTFSIDHGLMLGLLQRDSDTTGRGGGYRELVRLIERSHETGGASRRLRQQARQLFRELRAAGIIDVARSAQGRGSEVVVSEALQTDFSLMHTLSLFLVEAVERLPKTSTTYALDLVSLVESILEQPRPVLFAQERKLKGEFIGQWKAEGVEYDERMKRLEEVTWPMPNKEWTWEVFNDFATRHPWVRTENVRPKSIVRDMIERWMPFSDYIRELGLSPSEGVLLRYLSTAYKTLVQSVPDAVKTEEVHDAIAWLRTTLQAVDSSHLEEWERLLARAGGEVEEAPGRPADISSDGKAFRARIRAELHHLVMTLSRRDFDASALAIRQLEGDEWDAERFALELTPFFEEHETLRFDHQSRLTSRTTLQELAPHQWKVFQVLLDPSDENLWAVEGWIDLRGNTNPIGPMISLVRIGT